MGDQDQGFFVVVDEGEEELAELLGVGVVEVAGGLVGEDEVGIVAEGAGDGGALPLSAGEELGGVIGSLGKADLIEELEAFGAGEGIACDAGGHEDVFEGGEIVEEIIGLEDEADVAVSESAGVGRSGFR